MSIFSRVLAFFSTLLLGSFVFAATLVCSNGNKTISLQLTENGTHQITIESSGSSSFFGLVVSAGNTEAHGNLACDEVIGNSLKCWAGAAKQKARSGTSFDFTVDQNGYYKIESKYNFGQLSGLEQELMNKMDEAQKAKYQMRLAKSKVGGEVYGEDFKCNYN